MALSSLLCTVDTCEMKRKVLLHKAGFLRREEAVPLLRELGLYDCLAMS